MNSKAAWCDLRSPFLLGLLVVPMGLAEVRAQELNLLPQPAKIRSREGRFEFNSQTVLVAGKGAASEAPKLAAALRAPSGLPLPLSAEAETGCIALQWDRSLEAVLGREGYRLAISPQRISIAAAAEPGLFYGGITLRQLLPAYVSPSPPSWFAPCVEIEDVPRFSWRGILLDPARHFMPPEFVKKFIDLLALHKMNTLQLHLTDDQGWRIEIKQYPRLTEIGSVRKESPKKGDRKNGDGTPYGPFFYTQEQIRDLVAYGRERHVTLVPEIEMPGHFLAALAAYPEFSCRGGPFEVRTRWGIEPDILCPGNEKSLAFVEDILSEVVALFPSRIIHIGGDEAPRDRWKGCPKCQARMKAEGFQSEAQLQTWLNGRIETFLAQRGRRLIGWDEILDGGLTPDAAVMSWRGTKGGLAAAAEGHDVIMAPNTHCYFDHAQARGPNEPECINPEPKPRAGETSPVLDRGLVPLDKVYEFEPLSASLPPAKHGHILGVQGTLWSEYLWTPQDVEYFAFPRTAALAEVAWSPAARRDFGDFQRRLRQHLSRLDELHVNYRKP